MTAKSNNFVAPAKLAAQSVANASALDLVLLHGLGFSARVWTPLSESLTQNFRLTVPDLPGFGANNGLHPRCWDDFLEPLLPVLPRRAVYFGWSFGGLLAIVLASRHPERVAALVSCGTNPCFSKREDWPSGLDDGALAEFGNVVQGNNWSGVRRRLAALTARGDRWPAELRYQLLQACAIEPSRPALEGALRLLIDGDLRTELQGLQVPVLHILGSNDALMDCGQLVLGLRKFQQQRVAVLSGAGHAPFLSRPRTVSALVRCFATDRAVLPPLSAQTLDRRRVARSFSGAAEAYDSAALLQREVGMNLIERLPKEGSIGKVLDMGCGTGRFLQSIQQHYPRANVIALDLALGMVRLARHRDPKLQYCCGDAEQLPLCGGRLGLIFSNLTLQWCDNPGGVLQEVRRTLRPGGYFIFSTFAPETLWELRTAWRAADEHTHVHQFVSPLVWQCMADDLGMCWREFSLHRRIKYYRDMRTLLRELKMLGAHNSSRAARRGLTGPRRLAVVESSYEDLRTADGLPATYQLLYGVLQKP